MIEVESLTVRVGGFQLKNVQFEVPTGSHAILMGSTGAGKTTLLEAICGLKPIETGVILLKGRRVERLRPAERGIGYVPQDRALFPMMTVRQHLAFGLKIRRLDRKVIDQRVEELAQLLEIESLLHRTPGGLSGGEVQRVALGRALAVRPEILCLDEPLTGLDPKSRDHLCELLRVVRRTTQVTLLHVTHNLDEARSLADQTLHLKDGRVERLA